jgi:hypothetical protein
VSFTLTPSPTMSKCVFTLIVKTLCGWTSAAESVSRAYQVVIVRTWIPCYPSYGLGGYYTANKISLFTFHCFFSTTPSFSFQGMSVSLLRHLEDRLGRIDTWPTLILPMLFIEEPTPRSTHILASFFCGNWIALDVATKFYALCIGHSPHYIHEITSCLYTAWQHISRHLSLYYDMMVGRLIYINGNQCLERREPPTFDLGDLPIPLGFACLGGRNGAIEDKLCLASATPRY